jgi:hypothetical protein
MREEQAPVRRVLLSMQSSAFRVSSSPWRPSSEFWRWC